MPSVVGIIDQIEHLPIGVLDVYLDHAGPYGAGNHVLDTWLDGAVLRPVNITMGVVLQINGAIAPYLGSTPGFDDGGTIDTTEYELRIVQLVALHQTLLGTWLATQVADVFYAPILFRWVESNPGRIGLYVSPSWSIDLYYLLPL